MEHLKLTKLIPKWTGLYQILKAHWLGTYALRTPEGRVPRPLVHGNRLRKAHCKDVITFWNKPDPKIEKLDVRPASKEMLEVLDKDEPVLDIKSWSTLSESEWRRLQNF